MTQTMHEISSVQPRDPDLKKIHKSRRFKYINVPFIVIASLLVLLGLVVQYSATAYNEEYSFFRQLLGVIIGIILTILLSKLDYHALSGYTIIFLIITVVLILLPLLPFIGVEVNGARAWVKLGPISFQPAEFAKITVVLLSASVVARYGGKLDDLREYLKTLCFLAIPCICIMLQPDLGTALVFIAIAIFTLIAGGVNLKYFLITLGIIVACVVALFVLDPVFDSIAGSDVLLKDYQRARLLVFLDPSYDSTGDGYNLQQAMIAVGSGGLFGKGFMQATQSTLGFLPEAPTDFVFCIYAEEFGFFGALILLALYAILIVIIFRVARNAQDLFGSLIVCGVAGMWIFQILENIGMDIGLMPITGIPLPFISYGSSFMIVNFVMLGLINSVWIHSNK